MPINANHEYFDAEKKYLSAKGLEDKVYYLEELIRVAPKHKSSENLLAELRTRLKKFKSKLEKSGKKSGGKKGIKKEGFQFVLVGKTNSGKSLLLSKLTNAHSISREVVYSTKKPMIGTFDYEGVKAQIVDLPSVGSEEFDIGIINSADCILLVVDKLDDVKELKNIVKRGKGNVFVIVNKSDLLDFVGLHKLVATLKSKKIDGTIVSASTGDGLDVLKQLLFREMGVVRVYTKEPGKHRTKLPIVLKKGATVRKVAEKILKGFSDRIKETRLTGPSGKFVNQMVGLNHIVKDLDVVEFHT